MEKRVCLWGITKGKGSGIGHDVYQQLILDDYSVMSISRKKVPQAKMYCDSYCIVDKGQYLEELNFLKPSAIISFIGTGYDKLFFEYTAEEIEKTIQANLVGPFNIIAQSFPYISANPDCKIIICGSIAAVKPEEGNSIYSGSKGGMRAMVESLRCETKALGLNVSMLHFQNINTIGIDNVYNALVYQINSTCTSDIILA